MKKNRGFEAEAAALVLLLVFSVTLAACSGKTAKAESSGGDSAADPKQAAGAAKGGGQPAAATDFVYELNKAEDGVVITGIQEDAKFGAHLVIPAEIEGFPVVAYLASYSDDSAKQRNQPPLESVVFPDSIIYLGPSGRFSGIWKEYGYEEFHQFTEGMWAASFSECKSLKSIVFPKNLKIIPKGFAFNCPSLATEGITWPEAPEAIGPSAFARNSFTNLVIPDGVKFIGDSLDGAFAGSKTLRSVTIPDSIEVIGAYTFAECPELTTVKIPAHPINYPFSTGLSHNWAFRDCPKIGLAAQTAIMDTGYLDF